MRNHRFLLILSFVALAAAGPGAQNKTIAPTEKMARDEGHGFAKKGNADFQSEDQGFRTRD